MPEPINFSNSTYPFNSQTLKVLRENGELEAQEETRETADLKTDFTLKDPEAYLQENRNHWETYFSSVGQESGQAVQNAQEKKSVFAERSTVVIGGESEKRFDLKAFETVVFRQDTRDKVEANLDRVSRKGAILDSLETKKEEKKLVNFSLLGNKAKEWTGGFFKSLFGGFKDIFSSVVKTEKKSKPMDQQEAEKKKAEAEKNARIRSFMEASKSALVDAVLSSRDKVAKLSQRLGVMGNANELLGSTRNLSSGELNEYLVHQASDKMSEVNKLKQQREKQIKSAQANKSSGRVGDVASLTKVDGQSGIIGANASAG